MRTAQGQRLTTRSLIARILKRGWTEENARAFDAAFASDIQRLVILNIWRLGLVEYRPSPASAERVLRERCLELYENSLSDIWIALLSRLIQSYSRVGSTRMDRSSFLSYLAGAVRHTVIDNARELELIPMQTEGELIRECCAARRQDTQSRRLASTMLQLQAKARVELLESVSADDFGTLFGKLPAVVAHFFEVFVVSRCSDIQEARSSRRVLSQLIIDYVQTQEWKNGLEYSPTITPINFARRTRVSAGRGETDLDEESFLSMLAVGVR